MVDTRQLSMLGFAIVGLFENNHKLSKDTEETNMQISEPNTSNLAPKNFKIVFPGSYEELRKLSLKGQKLKCDCSASHRSYLSNLLWALTLGAAVLFIGFLLIGCGLEQLNYSSILYFGFAGLSLVVFVVLNRVVGWFYERDWLAAHEDVVLKKFIPAYLLVQISLVRYNLIGGYSPFRQTICKVELMLRKGLSHDDFTRQFISVDGGVKELSPYLTRVSQEAQQFLGFGQPLNTLREGQELASIFLERKRTQVLEFQRSMEKSNPSSVMALAREAWRQEAINVLVELKIFRTDFNQFFRGSGIGMVITPNRSSHDAAKCANVFFDALSSRYPNCVFQPASLPSAGNNISEPVVPVEDQNEVVIVSEVVIASDETGASKSAIEDSISEVDLEELEEIVGEVEGK